MFTTADKDDKPMTGRVLPTKEIYEQQTTENIGEHCFQADS